MRAPLGVVLILVACVSAAIAPEAVPAAAAPHTQAADPNAQMLFCAYWSYSDTSRPSSSRVESHFAVAVVEINSPVETDTVSVSDFALFGEKDATIAHMQRLLKVESFDEPHVAGESNAKYYLGTDPAGGTRFWDGTMPAGKIRLRVSAALVEDPTGVLGCRVTVGKYVIEGPLTFTLAT
jgi:hypothetical protein